MESARAQWGGFRRGKIDVQAPRRVDVRNLALEGLGRTRRPGSNDSARRPRLGGGLRKAAPWYRRASLLGPQAALEAVFGAVLGALGRVFWAVLGGPGRSWDVLGQFWGVLGWSWRILGGPGAVLCGSLACLGGVFGGLGGVLGGLGGVLGGDLGLSWGTLGPLGSILGHLGSILEHLGDILVPFLLGLYFVTDFYFIL